jgi:AraC-like DNA-binding protein
MNERFIITNINRIILVGQNEYTEKTTQFPTKYFYHHELIYHFSGEFTVNFNEKILKTYPNTIRYLPSGPCEKYIVDRQTRGECIDIFFTSNIPLADSAFVIPVKNEKIANLFKKIFSLWVAKDDEYYLECVSLLYKIIAEMKKTNYLPDAQFQKIKPAIDYIHNNFLSEETITAERLTQLCGISYSYIKKLFDLKFNISPKKYILSLKMNYACDLLRHGEYSISQIAEMCGYNDLYTFSHQFKITLGISPSAFIKKYKSSK